jgi:hypothetical protein
MAVRGHICVIGFNEKPLHLLLRHIYKASARGEAAQGERSTMSKIYASFSDPALAEKAAGALLDYGVKNDDISVVRNGSEADYSNWKSTQGSYDNRPAPQIEIDRAIQGSSSVGTAGMYAPDDTHFRAAEKTSQSDYTEDRVQMDLNENQQAERDTVNGITTTTARDAGAGAAVGAGLGLGVGVLAALAAVFLPGIGLVIGGGALATALGGAAAATGAGAIAGGVTGYLKDQGMEEHVATDYHNTVAGGGAFVEVNLPSGKVDEVTAREILDKYGASNVGAYAGSTNRSYVS